MRKDDAQRGDAIAMAAYRRSNGRRQKRNQRKSGMAASWYGISSSSLLCSNGLYQHQRCKRGAGEMLAYLAAAAWQLKAAASLAA